MISKISENISLVNELKKDIQKILIFLNNLSNEKKVNNNFNKEEKDNKITNKNINNINSITGINNQKIEINDENKLKLKPTSNNIKKNTFQF